MKKLIAVVMTFAFVAVAFAASPASADGAGLFKSKKCKTCHNLTGKKKVGPGLKGVSSKRSEAWLTKWLTDPQATWEENDAETQELKKWKKGRDKAKKTKMKIKKLSPAEISELIAFLKANG